MNTIQLLRFIFPLFAGLILSYVSLNAFILFKRNPKDNFLFYFIIALIFMAVNMLIYSITPFLEVGQESLAEITLGWSIILIMIAIPFYAHYLHLIYQEISWISKIYYIASGAGFISLLNNPWKIYMVENLGFYQDVSLLLIILLSIQGGYIFILSIQALNTIQERIELELTFIGKNLKKSANDGNRKISSVMKKQKQLLSKKRNIDLLKASWTIGIFLTILGLALPGTLYSNLDSIGMVIIFFPQAYFLTRDRDLLITLNVHKARDSAIQLQKSLSKLQKQLPQQVFSADVQSLLKFIEKADSLLYFQEEDSV